MIFPCDEPKILCELMAHIDHYLVNILFTVAYYEFYVIFISVCTLCCVMKKLIRTHMDAKGKAMVGSGECGQTHGLV